MPLAQGLLEPRLTGFFLCSNPRMSYDSASSYVRLNLTIAAAGAAGAGNASLALNLPMSQEDLVRPFAPTHPLWAVTGLDNATHINTTAYAILGNASAHSFLTNLYSVRSTLFGHLAAAGTPIGGLAQGQVGLAPPQSIAVTNITYGYFQQFNESSGVHAQIFTYGHGAPDLLTNQSVYWQFHAKKVDNVTVIRPNATSNWTTTQVIGTSQATPSSQPTTQLTSSQPTPSHSSIATQTGLSTTPGPTYTPKVPVTGFAFGYNFSSNAGATIDLSFQSGYDVCSALQQQVTLTGTGLPGIGNLTAAGRTIFTCDASRTFVTSFYSKIVLESLPFTAFGTDLNLSDVSLALSCLPHSSTCAIPSGSVGSTAFSWANSLNISQWSNVTGGNFSDYINNPPGTNRSLISVAPNLAAMLPVAQQMPSFIVQNQLAYAMLNSSDGKFSLPTPTFMCPSNFTQLCASPGVALAGTLQFGSFNLSYGVDIDWDGKNGAAEITSQTFAAQIGDYGVILATLNGSSVCDSNLQLTAQFTNLPFGLANIDPVAGSLSFECGNGTALSAYYLSLDLPSIEVSLPVISSTSIFIPSPVVQFDTGTGLFAVEWPLQNSENPLSQPLKYGVGFLVSDVLQTFNLSVAPSSPGNVTLISLWTSAPTPLKSFFEAFMATEFQSFAADAYLNPFSFQMDTSSHLVSLQVGMQSTRSGAVVTGDFTIQVAYNASASPMFSVASETLTVELDFQGGGYVRLVQQYLACSMNASNAAQPGSSGFGNFSLTLEGIGLLAGTCYVVFECGHDDVTSWINTTYFNGTVTGPINISVLGVQIEVDSVSISYSTDSGVLNATAAFNTTNVALSYILPTPSNGLSSSHMASLSLMETAQAVSPFGSDFPFSTAWVDVLGSANVEILAKDMLVSNLSISYTCDAPGVANASETLYLAGNVDFEPVDLSLAVNMTKPIRPNSSWIVDDASLSFAVGSYMLINVQGDSPCAAPNQTVNVELSQVGPISALQGSGLILFSCDANNSIVDYSFEISVPAFEMSAFGETESLMGSFAFNKSNDLLLVTAASATDSWTVTANVTVHNSTLWAFAYTLGNATDFSSLPFGAGVGNAFSAASASLSSLSNGLMANVMATYSNYPGLFTFFGDFDSQIGSFALGSSLYVTMNRSSPGANWVISTQLDLAGAITIGDYGKIGFNSTLACPNGAANIVAIFNGIPGIPSIDASGTVTYECAPTNSSRKRSLPNIQNYNASVSLDSMVISLFGEQVEISNVTVSYQSASKVLNISGTAVMSGSTLDAGIMVSASFDLSGPSAVLSMLQMDVAVGTTALFGGNLPFSGFLGGSLDQSGQSLISPTADLGELVVVYQNGPGLPPNMTIQASINDGSLAGKLFMLLENGPASINNGTQKANASSVTKWFPVFGTVLVDLGAYGTLELNGTSPCPLGTTGGSITLVGDLELPAIGQQTITGEVDFTCNSTGSIIGYVAKLSDTFNLSLSSINNAWCEVQGTLVYDSVGNTFELSASAPDSSAIVLSLTVQGNQDYTVAFFVNSSANFSDLPFANGLGSIIDGPGITQNGPLSTLELLVADFEFRHPNSSGFNETLIFSAALEDQFGLGSSGSANASFVFTKANTSSPWHVVEADLVLALSISDVLTVTLDFNATCPGAFGSATARFSSLPLQIAPFSIGGTVEFQCVGNTVNYTNYTIVLGGQSFGNSLGIDFTFFGESIDIPFPTIVIPSWPQPQVNFNWNWTHPNWTIPFSLAIGPLPGSKSSSQASSPAPPGASVQKGFNWPFKLGFSLAGSVTVADVIDMVASFFTPFGSVGGDIAGFLSGLASNAQAFFNTFGALSFSDLFVSMDPVTGLQFSGQISIFGYVTDFWFLATQQQTACSSGSWTLFYGVKLFDGTPGTFNSAEFPWLNSLFGANSSLSFQDVVFGVATGCGSYNIGDFSFSAPSPGILIAGDILFEGPMTSIVGNTGSFGNQLDSKAGTSDSLDFVIEISPESLSLIIDLESNMTASTSQSFMDISLQLVVDFTKYELSFYFNFEYSRVLGTDAILFDGALGISIMPDAVTLDGLFMMVAKNGWNNPFGLCSNLTIYSLGLSMQFDPEVMLPVSFGMEFNATLGNVFAQGQLLISAATPEAGNAVQLAMGNLFLGDIVYTFLDFIPSWMQNTLNQISLQYVDFSFNPSVSPAQFSASQPVIPPGLFLNVTNLDFLNIVTVESAIISQQGETLMADLQLAPMNFGSVISVTSATVSGGGPSGGLIIGPSNCRISFDGQASLFGSTYSAAGYFHTDPETGASTAAINVTWTDSFNDTVEVSLVESTGGYSSSSWSFALTFTLTSTYQGGFFAGVVASYVAWLNEELGYIAGNITSAVNSQADSMKASAQQVYEAAVATANLAEVDADAALQSAQDSVNNLQSQVPSCSSESSDCSNAHWYSKAYYCAIYAGCEVGAAAMQGTLWVAEQTLSLAESAVNDAVAAFDDAMSAANTALQDAISAAQDLVDSVMSAVQWAINSLASGLSTAIGVGTRTASRSGLSILTRNPPPHLLQDFINLVYLQISDTLSSSAQETFAGTATFGCFGSAPQTYSITFSINSVLTTLETITENCAEGLTHWVAAQLEGTKAAQFFSSMV